MSGMDSKRHYAVLVLPLTKLGVESLHIVTHLRNKLTFILKLFDKITQMNSHNHKNSSIIYSSFFINFNYFCLSFPCVMCSHAINK